jgi:hypothetical protein
VEQAALARCNELPGTSGINRFETAACFFWIKGFRFPNESDRRDSQTGAMYLKF